MTGRGQSVLKMMSTIIHSKIYYLLYLLLISEIQSFLFLGSLFLKYSFFRELLFKTKPTKKRNFANKYE